jgi:hypothetical protein
MSRYRVRCGAPAATITYRGAEQDLRGAIWAYDHADWCVAEVPQKADSFGGLGASGGGLVAGWSSAPALNQYDPANYTSAAARRPWQTAACSGAALDWLLGAYGARLGSIDRAIALIGPNTGISPTLGLLHATGRPLANAIAVSGLPPARRAGQKTPGGRLRQRRDSKAHTSWASTHAGKQRRLARRQTAVGCLRGGQSDSLVQAADCAGG